MAKVKAKLTLSDEPFEVGEDELEHLRHEGLLEHVVDPKPVAKSPSPDTKENKPS